MLTSVHDRHGTIEGLLNGWWWRYAPVMIFPRHSRRLPAVLVGLMFSSVLHLGMGQVPSAQAATNPFCNAVKALKGAESVVRRAQLALSFDKPFPNFRKTLIATAQTVINIEPTLTNAIPGLSVAEKNRIIAATKRKWSRLKASLSAATNERKAFEAYGKWFRSVAFVAGSLPKTDPDYSIAREARERCGINLMVEIGFNPTLQTEPIAFTPREVLDQLNRRGGEGYAFKGAFFFGTTGLPTALFVQTDPGAKYEYVAEQSTLEQQTKEGLLATLQKRGGQGFVLQGPLANLLEPGTVSLIFLKNSTKKTTFGYRIEPRPTDETASISLMNANGADGYVYIGDYVPELSKPELIVSMFVKDNSSAAKYSYETGPVLDTIDQIFAELNARGAVGAGWKGTYLAGTEAKMLYEKSSEFNGPLEYAFGPASTSAEALVSDAIERGAAKGLVFSGQYSAGGQAYNFYTNAGTRSVPIG
jgi:hypothetical protein